MSVSRNILIEQIIDILREPVESLGYIFISSPPVTALEFWFEKQPSDLDTLYRIIEFQPSGFSSKEIFKLAINLNRRSYRDYHNPPEKIENADQGFAVRLSPYIWSNESTVTDYWWHFSNIEELRKESFEMLEKLIDYGIPLLENPNIAWRSLNTSS